MSRHPSTVAAPWTAQSVAPRRSPMDWDNPIETDGIAAATLTLRSFRIGLHGPAGGNALRVRYRHDAPEVYTRSCAPTVMERLNATFDRIRYTMDNPDAALTFVDDVPTLVATDASGIDHETLFKLGRS